jgi:hypothetical protein
MEAPAPRVWTWYRVYAGLMALMYVAIAVGGGLAGALAPMDADDPPRWFFMLVFGCMGGPLGAAYIAAFFLPRRPWVWVYHLVLISIGLTSVCCMPASIPLLIHWIKPETKQYFGRV